MSYSWKPLSPEASTFPHTHTHNVLREHREPSAHSHTNKPFTWGGGRWVHGGGCGCGEVSQCTHTHAHTYMHARTCMLNMLIMLNMDASMSAAICNFYTCIHVCMCMCVCAHACACVGEQPPMPPDAPDTPPPTCPLPRAAGSPKQQNSISPELIEIIRFCLKILYL